MHFLLQMNNVVTKPCLLCAYDSEAERENYHHCQQVRLHQFFRCPYAIARIDFAFHKSELCQQSVADFVDLDPAAVDMHSVTPPPLGTPLCGRTVSVNVRKLFSWRCGRVFRVNGIHNFLLCFGNPMAVFLTDRRGRPREGIAGGNFNFSAIGPGSVCLSG